MKKIIILILLLSISCSSQSNLNKVINKFKTDNSSLLLYKNICEKYKYNKEESYDVYIKEYNLREPFPRLFDYRTIEHFIKIESCSKKSYLKFISNKNNYIQDDRTDQYMRDYLILYKINVLSD